MALEDVIRANAKALRKERTNELRPLLEETHWTWPFYPNGDAHFISPVGVARSGRRLGRQRDDWLREQDRLASTDFTQYLRSLVSPPISDSDLAAVLTQHGVFADWAIRRDRYSHFESRLRSTELDLYEWSEYAYKAWGHKPPPGYEPEWHFIVHNTYRHMINQAMFRLAESGTGTEILSEWYGQCAGKRRCIFCRRIFDPVWLYPFMYFFSHCETRCCFNCRILENPSGRELSRCLRIFAEHVGFIPPTYAHPVYWPFTSRIKPEHWPQMVLNYAKMGGISNVLSQYETWFEALAESGALPDGVLITSRGIRCLARDGHVCHSLDEQTIDNWLFERGIEHEREPRYPFHSKLNSGGRRADFRVGDYWIEYFGMAGDASYDAKIVEKMKLADEMGIKLIALYPHHISQLDRALALLLTEQSRAIS